jgi:hypothetical protein
MPWGIEGEVGVGCRGGRDMKFGSLGCGGVGATGEGFGSEASGFAGMTSVESGSREAAGNGAGISIMLRFSG